MSQALTLNPPIFINFRLNLVLKIFWFFVFISIISLFVFYVFQINSLTGENHLLKNQEKKLAQIKKEAEILKIDFAKANSLANVETYFQDQNFKKTNQVKYIRISDTSVAARSEMPRE